MLWILAVVLALFWAIGLATSYTLGGLIHVLLAAAVAAVVVQVMARLRTT